MDEKNGLVSVIVPVYNAERFLEAAVRSALEQTYSELEILLIDDGSQDGSRRIEDRLAQTDPRVRVIPLEHNGGVANARNVGTRQARGSYIALLDSDDFWERDKLERQMKLLRETGAQIAYCSYDIVDELGRAGDRVFRVPPATCYRDMLAKSVMSCSTTLAEAWLFQRHPMRAEFQHEDYVLWMELLREPDVRAVGIPEVLAHYRMVSGSRSHNKLKSALGRWKVYRDALGMGPVESAAAFLRYAVNGVIKYYG